MNKSSIANLVRSVLSIAVICKIVLHPATRRPLGFNPPLGLTHHTGTNPYLHLLFRENSRCHLSYAGPTKERGFDEVVMSLRHLEVKIRSLFKIRQTRMYFFHALMPQSVSLYSSYITAICPSFSHHPLSFSQAIPSIKLNHSSTSTQWQPSHQHHPLNPSWVTTVSSPLQPAFESPRFVSVP
jgi:hypothetical protein